MTVSSQQSEVPYTGDGTTTIFPIPFYFLQNSDIQIVVNDSLGNIYPVVQNVDYTVSGAGNQAGGSVTFGVAPVNLRTVTIQRIVPATQLTDYQPNDDFPAETHERALDKLTMLVQQSFAGLGRALVRPQGKNFYDAKNYQIKNLADPTDLQDATTKNWVSTYFASLIDQASGVINTTTGILYDTSTLFDYLRIGVARNVDTIAALRVLASSRNQRAFVLGYYAKGDSGGGEYFVDPADTTSLDDGGSVIVAADGARWKLATIDHVNVHQFGARGVGTDDTVAINNALKASPDVKLLPGHVYGVSATLKQRPRTSFWGVTAENTQLLRNGADYGPTLEIGDESSDPAGNANLCHVHGIWFQRSFSYTPGVTTTIPDPLSISTSHIKLNGGQKAIIEDCMIWNTPILIDVLSSSLVTIRNNGFLSMIHDNRVAGLQEGFCAIRLRNSAVMSAHTQLVNIHGNHINGGYFSASRAVTTGSVSTPMVECVGALYGVYVEACEGLSIHDNYLGAFNANNVYLNTIGLITNIKIWGNFIDGSRDYAILMNSTNGNPTVGVQIFGNDFNLQLINFGAIYALGTGWTTVTKLSVSGNNIENSIMTPILLFSAEGANITGNNISAYNVRRGGDSNSLFAAGILVGGSSTRVFASGNSYGGNINTLGAGNGCKWGIYYDGVGLGFACDEYDLGRSLSVNDPLVFGGMASPATPVQAIHNAATGNFQVLPSHSVYIRAGTATSATLAALPVAPAIGQEILFKDNSNASAFSITIQDISGSPKLIDGAASIAISTTNAFLKLRYNGTQWNRIG